MDDVLRDLVFADRKALLHGDNFRNDGRYHNQSSSKSKMFSDKFVFYIIPILSTVISLETLKSLAIQMPDVEMLSLLSKEFGVSMNELVSGERLAAEDFQKAADQNLAAALDNSTFTLKEKITFFKKKWRREHIASMVLSSIAWLAVVISLKLFRFCGR